MTEVLEPTLILQELIKLKKELNEATYQLSILYDRWVVEHQHVGKREAEMLRAMELFPKQFAEMRKQAREEVRSTVAEAATLAIREIGKETSKQFDKSIGDTFTRFNKVLVEVEEVLPKYEKMKFSNWAKGVIIIIILSAATGFLFGSFWVLKNTIRIEELYQKIYEKKKTN